MSNELERLTRENKYGVQFTNTMRFISKSKVPKHKKVTYANFRADFRPLKPKPYSMRYMVGGKLKYFKDTASPTTIILEVKLLLNSISNVLFLTNKINLRH